MEILTIPLNTDNYGYIVRHGDRSVVEAVVVDASGQPDAVMRAAADLGVSIAAVLTTHKHWDHAGGNDRIKECIDGVRIIGPLEDAVEGCTEPVCDGQLVSAAGFEIRCIHTPGHTLGHMCYFIEHDGETVVFTGDTLFIGGCGKFFEGTGADMSVSLYDKLSALPGHTKVYCGHEYTLSNYRFALHVDPDNRDLLAANERATELRREGKPTVPSTISAELATNPFLRAAALKRADEDVASFLNRLRESKNNFK